MSPGVTEHLQIARPLALVLDLTGCADSEIVRRWIARGDVELLEKPFTTGQLTRACGRCSGSERVKYRSHDAGREYRASAPGIEREPTKIS